MVDCPHFFFFFKYHYLIIGQVLRHKYIFLHLLALCSSKQYDYKALMPTIIDDYICVNESDQLFSFQCYNNSNFLFFFFIVKQLLLASCIILDKHASLT